MNISPRKNAGVWFSLIIVVLFLLLILSSPCGLHSIKTFFEKVDDPSEAKQRILSISLIIVPIAASFLFGWFIGQPIISRKNIYYREACLRGGIIAMATVVTTSITDDFLYAMVGPPTGSSFVGFSVTRTIIYSLPIFFPGAGVGALLRTIRTAETVDDKSMVVVRRSILIWLAGLWCIACVGGVLTCIVVLFTGQKWNPLEAIFFGVFIVILGIPGWFCFRITHFIITRLFRLRICPLILGGLASFYSFLSIMLMPLVLNTLLSKNVFALLLITAVLCALGIGWLERYFALKYATSPRM